MDTRRPTHRFPQNATEPTDESSKHARPEIAQGLRAPLDVPILRTCARAIYVIAAAFALTDFFLIMSAVYNERRHRRRRPDLAERLRPFHPPSVADEAQDWLHHQGCVHSSLRGPGGLAGRGSPRHTPDDQRIDVVAAGGIERAGTGDQPDGGP